MSQSSDLGSERNWHICQNLISTALTWCWSKMISLFLSILCAHPTVSSIHQTSFLACIVSRQSFDFFERNKAAAIYPVCLITQPSYSHNFPKTKTAINNRALLYLNWLSTNWLYGSKICHIYVAWSQQHSEEQGIMLWKTMRLLKKWGKELAILA